MIIKARARAGGSQLAAYLLNRDGEERAEVLEMRGFDCFGGNLKNALIGIEIESKEHARQNPLYHVSFRLEEGAALTPEQWRECADRLEKNLDLVGNPRALVMHEENGEKHLHVVWSRTNDQTGEYNYLHNDRYKCRDTGRELERVFDTRQLPYTRAAEHPNRADHEQAKRQERDIHDIQAEIRAAWEQSDNGASFENALADAGYILAKGDKRDFVAVDRTGQEYTIGKRITGATAAQCRAKCADLDRDFLPTVEEARGYQQEQQQQHDQARAEREAEQKKQQEQAQKTEQKNRDIAYIKNYGVDAFKDLDKNRARQVDGYKIYDGEQLSEMAEAAAQQNQQERQQQARDLKRYDILKHEPPAQEQPAPTQKPRLKFDLDSQEWKPADPAPVMTPEQFKDAAAKQATPEATKSREEATRAKQKSLQMEAIREAWEKSENGIEFAVVLGEAEFSLAKSEKEDKSLKWFKAVHISGSVHNLTPELLKEKSYTEIKEKLAVFIETPSLLDNTEQAREFWKAARANAAQEREAAATTKAEERRDAADAKAEEKGFSGILNTRAAIREAWEKSESGLDFSELIQGMGWQVARSEKAYSPYTVVDHKGKALDVAFTIGATGKTIKEALQDLDPATLRPVQEVQAQAKANAAEVTQAKTDGQDWSHTHNIQRGQDSAAQAIGKKPDVKPARTEAPAPSVGRPAAALGNGVLNLADSLLGGIAGPTTTEQTRQQAAGTQQRTAQQVQDAAAQIRQPLTPAEREAKAKEFDRAAEQATRARDAYKAITTTAAGPQKRAAMRQMWSANIQAKEAAKQAALLRETQQQREERQEKEREEREAERRRRERQRER